MPYTYTTPKVSGALVGGDAEKLDTPRLIELTGDVAGQAYFDGSKDIQIKTTVKATDGGLTSGDVGFGLAILGGKVHVDLPALIGEEFGMDGSGKLTIEAVDVNKLYVPDDTELVIGEVDDNG